MNFINKLVFLLSLIIAVVPTARLDAMERRVAGTGEGAEEDSKEDSEERIDRLVCFSCHAEINQAAWTTLWCHADQQEPHIHHQLCLTSFDGAEHPTVSCPCGAPLGACVQQNKRESRSYAVSYNYLCKQKAMIWRQEEFNDYLDRDHYKRYIINALARIPDINIRVVVPDVHWLYPMGLLSWALCCNAPTEVIDALLARPEINVHLRVGSQTPLWFAMQYGRQDVIKALLAHPNFDVHQELDTGSMAWKRFVSGSGDFDDLNLARSIFVRKHPYFLRAAAAVVGTGAALAYATLGC